MPYADIEKSRASARRRQKKLRDRERLKKYGNLDDHRGRHRNHARGPNNGRWNPKSPLSKGYRHGN